MGFLLTKRHIRRKRERERDREEGSMSHFLECCLLKNILLLQSLYLNIPKFGGTSFRDLANFIIFTGILLRNFDQNRENNRTKVVALKAFKKSKNF